MRNITKFLMLVVLCLVGMQGNAQNVTVHPGNGNMLPALKDGRTDTFFGWGGFATWKHEQLSLTVTTGDSDNNPNGASTTGQLEKPANDIFESANGKALQVGKGNSMSTYLTICLPKGYRFTGYEIKFHRISKPDKSSSAEAGENGNLTFGETNASFTYTNVKDTYADGIWYSQTTGWGWNQQTQYNTDSYTIKRTSSTDTDMTNTLYFKLSSTSNGRCFIELDHVELYFSAESNYVPLTQNITAATNVSAINIPFTTSKMDYGQLTLRNSSGTAYPGTGPTSNYRICYDGVLHDLNANLSLYEDGSVRQVTASENDFDGTAGFEVVQRTGSITTGEYFRLESTKHGKFADSETGEVFYYIETPTWAVNSSVANANKNPIGYRITGVKFNYAAGSGTTYLPATFYIEYESKNHGFPQDGIYGVNWYGGNLSYNYNYRTVWRIDKEGYIYHGSDYLKVDGTSIVVVNGKSNASQFEVVNGNIRQINTENYIGWNETEEKYIDEDGIEHTVYDTYEDENGVTIQTEVPRYIRTVVIAEDEAHRSTYNELQAATELENGAYTLKIYGPDGTEPVETIEVTGEGGSSEYWGGYNNDAVKIGVIGNALINGELTLQALDPYIDRLSIVCQENNGTGRVTQQFNATDFSVKGGEFTFYVPMDFQGDAKFTFENLYSHYGDNSYYNATNNPELHSRYFFVGSEYGDSYDNVYDRYNKNSGASYEDKIDCLKPGDRPYTFNNAATAANTNNSYFEEYPFSKALYQKKEGGGFQDFIFPASAMGTNTTKTAYLFTCDEPRYNIAPTTATQHVYYAFYEMTIKMVKKDYRPVFDWVKVYDNTFYNANNKDIEGEGMWGLTITTTETEDDNGTHSGYLTVSKILDVIEHGLDPTSAQETRVQGLDGTGTNAPESMNQILYIDASNLMSIMEDGENNTIDDIMAELGKNALIYLPFGSKPDNDNVAYNTNSDYSTTPNFRAANDIVLTDKNPFYAPYDIQVGGASFATYTRLITTPKYGQVQNATLMLPFGLSIDGTGTHTNEDGSCTFSINNLKSGTLVEPSGTNVDYYAVGFFAPATPNAEDMSEANVPYMVKVDEQSSESIEGENFSFVAKQKGAKIAKTPNVNFVKTLDAVTMGTVALTNEATYSGKTYSRDDDDVFYFAKNMFLNIHTLVDYKPTLYVYPFRSVYTYEGTLANKLNWIEVSYDEDAADGIKRMSMPANADLMIRSGKGLLEMEALRGQTVTVRSLAGMTVNTVSLNAGDSKTINLPSGVYIVNNVKIIVK